MTYIQAGAVVSILRHDRPGEHRGGRMFRGTAGAGWSGLARCPELSFC